MDNTPKSNFVTMIYNNGVLFGKYNSETEICIDAAKNVVELRKKITNYKLAPILVDCREVVKISKEARNYFASAEGSELLTAAAILVDSKLSSFLANFLLKVNLKKTELPIRVFNSQDEALDWLQKYK